MRALDLRNENALQKSQQAKDPQPYDHFFVDTKKYCPFCDEPLRQTNLTPFLSSECACSIWTPRAIKWGYDRKVREGDTHDLR